MTNPQIEVSEIASPLVANETTYVDGVAQIALGPFVSKITFGNDTLKGEPRRPVVTLVLPSPALVQLAQQLQTLLQTNVAREGMTKDLKNHIEQLSTFKVKD